LKDTKVMKAMNLARIRRIITLSMKKNRPGWSKMTTMVRISMNAEVTKVKKRIS
jgi:hypothetical protein